MIDRSVAVRVTTAAAGVCRRQTEDRNQRGDRGDLAKQALYGKAKPVQHAKTRDALSCLCSPPFAIYNLRLFGAAQGFGVGVATRTTICAVGPRLPATSLTFTDRMDSPGGNAAVVPTESQNCSAALAFTSRASPEASVKVHGAAGVKA